MRLQHGFTLLEILISLLILKIGLLGILAAQSYSLRQLQDAIQRTQAVAVSSSLINLIQSNAQLLNQLQQPITLHTEIGADILCSAVSPCSPAESARAQFGLWHRQLRAAGHSSLIDPVFCVEAGGSSVNLDISWQQANATEIALSQCEPGTGRSGFSVKGAGG